MNRVLTALCVFADVVMTLATPAIAAPAPIDQQAGPSASRA